MIKYIRLPEYAGQIIWFIYDRKNSVNYNKLKVKHTHTHTAGDPKWQKSDNKSITLSFHILGQKREEENPSSRLCILCTNSVKNPPFYSAN